MTTIVQTPDVTELSELHRVMQQVICGCPYYDEVAIQHESYTASEVFQYYQSKDHIFLVVKREDKIVGFLHAHDDFGTCWVNWIGVLPEYRRQGISRALLSTLEQIVCPAKKLHKIWLDVKVENIESCKLFAGKGYQLEATLLNHWYRADFYIYSKQLRVL